MVIRITVALRVTDRSYMGVALLIFQAHLFYHRQYDVQRALPRSRADLLLFVSLASLIGF